MGDYHTDENGFPIVEGLTFTKYEPVRHRDSNTKYGQLAGEKSNDGANNKILHTRSAASFANLPIPTREFLDERQLIPCRNVTMLTGDGGTGKSLLALQLALAVALGTPWLDVVVKEGPVLYLSAEEDQRETHSRLAAICASETWDLGQATRLEIACLAGEDAVLAIEDKKGRLTTTTLYNSLVVTLEKYHPTLLVLDNLADVFGGNEISRTQAKQFIGILRGLAIRFDCAVLLLGHPSLSGISTGAGTSGSTAWSNSVRSRLYLRKDANANGGEADPTVRLLETMKANYAPRGLPIGLQWKDGRFVRRDPPKPFDDVTLADLERVQDGLHKGTYRVADTSPDWGGYVVASILELDVGRGLSAKERTPEQARARTNVKQVLSTWVLNGALCIVEIRDAKSMPRRCYGVPDRDV